MGDINQKANTRSANTFFIWGVLLILNGAGLMCVLGLIASENAIHASLPTEEANDVLTNHFGTAIAIAALVTVGLIAAGFFVSKMSTHPYPFWYLILTGAIPGAMFLSGWRAMRDGVACRRGARSHGVRFALIGISVLGLLDVLMLCLCISWAGT